MDGGIAPISFHGIEDKPILLYVSSCALQSLKHRNQQRDFVALFDIGECIALDSEPVRLGSRSFRPANFSGFSDPSSPSPPLASLPNSTAQLPFQRRARCTVHPIPPHVKNKKTNTRKKSEAVVRPLLRRGRG
jgi:hypothetical protein